MTAPALARLSFLTKCPACNGRGSKDADNEIGRRLHNLRASLSYGVEYDNETLGADLRDVLDKVAADDLTCRRCLGTRYLPTSLGKDAAAFIWWLNHGGEKVLLAESEPFAVFDNQLVAKP